MSICWESKRVPCDAPFASLRLVAELFLGLRQPSPKITRLHPKLDTLQQTLEKSVQKFGYRVKASFRDHGEKLIARQTMQYRLSMSAIWLHAMTCSLAKADRTIRSGMNGEQLRDELTVVEHVFALGQTDIDHCLHGLRTNTDDSMRATAAVAARWIDALPNSDFVIPEKTPDPEGFGSGRVPQQADIPQFGSGSTYVGKHRGD